MPIHVYEWEYHNPVPKKLYWDEDDKVVNYYNYEGFNDSVNVGDDLKELESKIGKKNELSHLWYFINGIVRNVAKVRWAVYDQNSGVINFPTPVRDDLWEVNKEKRKKFLTQFEGLDNSIIEGVDNSTRKLCFKINEAVDKYHDERISNLTEEIWQKKIDPVYDEKYKKWKEERNKVKTAREIWENGGADAFRAWLGNNSYNHFVKGGIYGKIDDVINSLKRMGLHASGVKHGSGWNVFEDEKGVVEISSAVLTTKDIPIVKELLEKLKNEEFSNNTGAHIHVGMPAFTTAFDLLAVFWMLDEEYILQYAGREDEDIDRYAKSKGEFFKTLNTLLFSNHTENYVTYSDFDMFKFLDDNFSRYYGVNTIKAFMRHNTVELRFLSSQIVRDPDRYLSFIQYFMALPELATRKKELIINLPKEGINYRIVRQPGNKVMVTKDNRSVRQSGMPVDQLKKPLVKSDRWADLRARFSGSRPV